MYDKAAILLLSRFSQIPVTIYDSDWNIIEAFSKNNVEPQKYELSKFEELKSNLINTNYWFVSYDDNIPIGICGCHTDNKYFVLGPVAYGKIESFDYRKFIKKHKIRECPNSQLETIYLLAEYLGGKNVVTTKLEVSAADDQEFNNNDEKGMITNEELRQIDNFQMNHTLADEIAWFEHIRNGDVEYMERNVSSQSLSHPVMLSNVKKNEEYITAISISLAARAAIEGGVSSQEGFLNNDIYLKKMAECHTLEEVITLKQESQIHFAKLVAQNHKKNTTNIYVEKAKKYITSRRFERISIQDISESVGVSKDYLQKLFKMHEGLPITEYMSNIKIEAACNMLKYSDRKIQEISEYLHYGSVSHFSIAFRKRMNQSPKQYRDQHKATGF